MSNLLWEPTEESKRKANMTHYMEFLRQKCGLKFRSYEISLNRLSGLSKTMKLPSFSLTSFTQCLLSPRVFRTILLMSMNLILLPKGLLTNRKYWIHAFKFYGPYSAHKFL